MTTKKRFAVRTFALVSTAAIVVGCSKNQSSEDTPATTSGVPAAIGVSASVAVNAESMLSAYPSQLAIALFTNHSSTALRLDDAPPTDAQEKAAVDSAARPLKERGEEQEKRLKGAVDDCVADALKRPDINGKTESCYEFDQDMIRGSRGATDSVKGTANGLNADGTPCMVAFAKSRVAVVNDLLERAQGMISTMLCQAKKADASAEPPAAVGGVLDLKVSLGAAMGAKADKIKTAKLERLDDIDSLPVYKSTVEMVKGARTRTVVLVHTSGADGTYNGTLYTTMHEEALAGTVPAPGQSNANMDRVLSVTYAKVKTDTGFLIQGDLIRANVHKDLVAAALGDNGVLNLSAYRDFSVAESDFHYGMAKKADGSYYGHNEDASGQTRITFSVDPDTDAGTVSYAENPGSNYNEAARGMIAQVAIVDGVKKGCATSGAALGKDNLMLSYSIAKSQKDGVTLDFIGFMHPTLNAHIQNDAQTTCSMSADGLSDVGGLYFIKSCTRDGRAEEAKWYQPAVADAALAHQFVTDQAGAVVTRQCYIFDEAAAAYKIDTTEITDAAGYELVRSSVAGKLVAPPHIDAKVKPFAGDIGKKKD